MTTDLTEPIKQEKPPRNHNRSRRMTAIQQAHAEADAAFQSVGRARSHINQLILPDDKQQEVVEDAWEHLDRAIASLRKARSALSKALTF